MFEDFSNQFNARCWKAGHMQVFKFVTVYSAVWTCWFLRAGLEENVCVRPSLQLRYQCNGPICFVLSIHYGKCSV